MIFFLSASTKNIAFFITFSCIRRFQNSSQKRNVIFLILLSMYLPVVMPGSFVFLAKAQWELKKLWRQGILVSQKRDFQKFPLETELSFEGLTLEPRLLPVGFCHVIRRKPVGKHFTRTLTLFHGTELLERYP